MDDGSVASEWVCFYVSLANGRAALTLARSSNETLSDTADNPLSYIINAYGVS